MESPPAKLPTDQYFLFKMRTQLLICIEFINDLNEQLHAERNIIYTNVDLRGSMPWRYIQGVPKKNITKIECCGAKFDLEHDLERFDQA